MPFGSPTLKRLVPRPLRPTARFIRQRATTPRQRRARMAASLRGQGQLCARLGSPLYGALLDSAAADVVAQGPCWDVLGERPAVATGADEALPLRLMAGVHRLVLEGVAPDLAGYYPSAGGEGEGDPAPAFLATVRAHRDRLRDLLEKPVQTNEVHRCAALVGGFLGVAEATGLPLRLLEVGASAGLNLRWPEYFYVGQETTFGDQRSPVKLLCSFFDIERRRDRPVRVASRRGCDLAPLDPLSSDDRFSLECLVWPDDERRLEVLRGALDVAGRVPVAVDQADACDWVEAQLRARVEGAATVVFHSFMIQYLKDRGRERFLRHLEEAGRTATSGSPLAWLRLEWGDDQEEAELHLTTWPSRTTKLLARADNQGRRVTWLEG